MIWVGWRRAYVYGCEISRKLPLGGDFFAAKTSREMVWRDLWAKGEVFSWGAWQVMLKRAGLDDFLCRTAQGMYVCETECARKCVYGKQGLRECERLVVWEFVGSGVWLA